MGQAYQLEVANGRTNLWGDLLTFLEPESEHSSATACEGFALAGGRVTNFTSGQGLILMKEVLYTIAGKRLPVVFHIGARALTSQSLNVHAGHDDVMGVGDCGWGILFGRNAQEAGDLALIARRAAEASETPFLNVQDGFLTTHTIENVRLAEPELMAQFIGSPREKLRNYFDPSRPLQSGGVQNQDAYMKGKIAQRFFYDRVRPILQAAMQEYAGLTGRRYGFVDAYRLEDATVAIVGMGSLVETAAATVDWVRTNLALRAGTLHVTAFRPFPGPEIVDALKHVDAVAVVERMDNPLAQSNPLTAEIKAAFADALVGTPDYPRIHRLPAIFSGTAGLGSRDVRPGDLLAAVQHVGRHGDGSRYFTLGITHDLALKPTVDPDVQPPGTFAMRGHSVGGFGSMTTNKIIATIVGDLFDLHVQAYPLYGSEKKGLPTTYYLAVASERIRTHCELNQVDFVPLNDANAFNLGNPLSGLRDGGMVFLQSHETDPERVWACVPAYAQALIRERRLRLAALDTITIAREAAPQPELEQRMQGIVLLGIFLRSTPFIQQRGVSDEQIRIGIEKSLRKYFGRAGERVIAANMQAVMRGYREVFEVPRAIIEREPAEVTPTLPPPVRPGMHVRDLMHIGAITCSPDTPIVEVARMLTEYEISALVVVDGNGFALGVVSTTDLANAGFIASDLHFEGLAARHLMTSPVIVTHPGRPLAEAVQLLRDRGIHRLVVVEEGDPDHLRPVGVLSVTDLVRTVSELEPAAR
jgi:pyruvate-ferredoxin/flavodoxin oxidoreductase